MICPKCQHQWCQADELRLQSTQQSCDSLPEDLPISTYQEPVSVPRRLCRFSAAQIENLRFERKLSEDPIDANGYGNCQRCHLCKWYIEKGNLMLILSCKHRLHKKCLEVWFLSNSHCPICNEAQDLTSLTT